MKALLYVRGLKPQSAGSQIDGLAGFEGSGGEGAIGLRCEALGRAD